MELSEAVPWGQAGERDISMFGLTPTGYERAHPGLWWRPKQLNTELTIQGKQVTSCDPLYQFGKDEIARKRHIRDDVGAERGQQRQFSLGTIWLSYTIGPVQNARDETVSGRL